MSITDKLKSINGIEDHVTDRLLREGWEGLEVIEFAEHLLFPDKIYKRKADGTFDEKDIMLRVPRDFELRKARAQARALAAKDGLDEDRDKDLFDNIEVMCILSFAIRNNTEPYEPWIPDPLILERKYDKPCLAQIYGKVEVYGTIVDPKPEQISKEEMYALTASLASESNLLPLHVYGSVAQTSYIVTMANLLMNSPEFKSFCGLSEH
jgi:hypothetical protein